MSDLRRKLRKANAEYKVGKKTLLRLAAKQNNLPEFENSLMSGQAAAMFAYTEDYGAFKALYLFSKENEKLKILGGIVGGKIMSADEIKQLAILPSRDELLAKMLGSLMSPLSALARVLNAYKEKLEAPKPEAPAAASVASAPAAAAPAEAPKAETPATPAV